MKKKMVGVLLMSAMVLSMTTGVSAQITSAEVQSVDENALNGAIMTSEEGSIGSIDLSSVSLSSQTAEPGTVINVSFKAENAKSVSLNYTFLKADGQKITTYDCEATAEENYDSNTGYWNLKIDIPSTVAAGKWELKNIEIIDVNEKRSYLWNSELGYEEYEERVDLSGLEFEIVNAPEAEYDPCRVGRDVPYYNIDVDGGTFEEDENGKLRYILPDGTGVVDAFFCDGTYTYYLQFDGTPMTDRLTYHPNGLEVIYLDADGHEVFDSFVNVKKSISGDEVDDICYFNTYGYMYQDVTTYDQEGVNLYYINPYGVLQRGGYFYFSNGNLGYAEADGVLMTNQNSYDADGNPVYFQANGEAIYY